MKQLQTPPQRVNTGERSKNFRSPEPLVRWLAGDIYSRKIFPQGDSQIGISFVIGEAGVVRRMNVLDEPIFRKQCFPFAFTFDGVEIHHLGQHVLFAARPKVCGWNEITRHPVGQAFGFANVQHPSLGVFHQINPGYFG